MNIRITLRGFLFLVLIPSIVPGQGKTDTDLRQYIDLGGRWQFSIKEKKIGMTENWHQKSFPDSITLPGTLDENKKGFLNRDTTDMHLNRLYSYYGPAWFKKEITIPESWSGKRIELVMERTKVTHVWLDTSFLCTNNTIFSRQVYDLTGTATGGKHTLTIVVDNNPDFVPVAGSHAYSEDTQTNWNGILGQFCLTASNPVRIEAVKTYPDIHGKQVKVRITISNPGISLKKADIMVKADSWNTTKPREVGRKNYPIALFASDSTVELVYPLGDTVQLWSEFNPVLYTLCVALSDNGIVVDGVSTDFGMCEFKTEGTHFTVNGKKTFLRGRHDACVFPITGYPPMDMAGWLRMFSVVKAYGLNHVRFHSWCPPEAAFTAASILGIYLQPELPMWWSFKADDSSQVAFMVKEGKNILINYGNQPSFVMFALGNEVYQDRRQMKKLVDEFRKDDNRHLYAQGSNNFGGNPSQVEGDDYWTTFRTGPEKPDCSTDVRSSISFVDSREGGILNTISPSTSFTYSKAIENSSIPVIGHEVGQYQAYPNFSEIPKYTGVLRPWNLELYRDRLVKNGMGDQAFDFARASEALSIICYRADIETALRTPGFGGFQLLDLQDYPGQGTALVGILDAFMDSKGFITAQGFRRFCDDVVILLVMDKYCWSAGESFKAKILVANYSAMDMNGSTILWSMNSAVDGSLIKEGREKKINIAQGGLTQAGTIEYSLNGIQKAQKYLIHIGIENTGYTTAYPIWVYPGITKVSVPAAVTVTGKLDHAMLEQLNNGKSVLLFPDFTSIENTSVPGMFISEFWNYAMFTGFAKQNGRGYSPGTMGILTRPDLPVFDDFPTESHTNWQWWSILKNSRPLILDGTNKNYRPLVQVIDNINRNHKLGLIFEFRVGRGKLLVCTANLPAMTERPEACQLYSSILKYMKSGKFNPTEEISIADLEKILY